MAGTSPPWGGCCSRQDRRSSGRQRTSRRRGSSRSWRRGDGVRAHSPKRTRHTDVAHGVLPPSHLFSLTKRPGCHPERSEGSAFLELLQKQVLRACGAQDDKLTRLRKSE